MLFDVGKSFDCFEIAYFVSSAGSLVDLDATNSNSAAPASSTNAATTASADLWGDFDPVSSK